MNDAPNIVSNVECTDIGNLTLECIMTGVDRLTDLTSLNIHFGDSEILPETILSQSVSGQFAEITFTHTYESAGNYSITYQVQTGRGEELVKNQDYSVTDAPGNLPPVANLFCSVIYKTVNCDALGSVDYDGFITNYEFSFGNGETINNVDGQYFYTYPEIGTYTISLKVTDNFGTTSETSQVVVIEEKPNEFPVPELLCFSPSPLKLSCDGRNSYDPDGQIVGGRLTSLETNEVFETENLVDLQYLFSFSNGGEKQIKIEVLDDQGAMVERIVSVDVTENLSPTAFADCQSSEIGVLSCDASGSSDFDGQIVSYSWLIGGQTYSGANITVSGLENLTESVQLTVTDDLGATAIVSGSYSVFQNQAPIADFSCTSPSPWGIACSNLSSDSDNDTLTYSWQIKDQTITTKDIPFLQLYGGGTIQVSLTVSDGIASSNIAKPVTISENQAPFVNTANINLRGNVPYEINLNVDHFLDNDGSISSFSVEFNGETTSSLPVALPVTSEEKQVIRVTLVDNLGLSANYEIQINPNKAPVPSFDCSVIDSTLTCNSTSNDPDGTIAELFWSYPGESETQSEFFVEENVPTGPTVIKLRVKDNEGAENSLSKTLNLSNGDNKPSFAIDWDVDDNFLVTFKVSNPDFSIFPETKFEWEIDGSIVGDPSNQAISYQSSLGEVLSVSLRVTLENNLHETLTIPFTTYHLPVRGPSSINQDLIKGQDLDNNGVNDDYQEYFIKKFNGKEPLVTYSFEIHRAILALLSDPTNESLKASTMQFLETKGKCLTGTLGDIEYGDIIFREMYAMSFNNQRRFETFLQIKDSFPFLIDLNSEQIEDYKTLCD